jgi:hypothetical protein
MWDVGHPTTATDKIGRNWDGWNEEKLKVFEVMSPRPGAFSAEAGFLSLHSPI